MSKIIKRVEIVIEFDDERGVMTRNVTISKNLNTYEVVGILDALRVESLQALATDVPESEVKPDVSE